jgi:hypothetical protein
MTQAKRIDALEQGQQAIIGQLAALANVITGLQTSMLQAPVVAAPVECWLHQTDCGPVCPIADNIRALRQSHTTLADVDAETWVFIVDAVLTGYETEHGAIVAAPAKQAPKVAAPAKDAAPAKQAPKDAAPVVVSAAFKAVCKETAKQALANQKQGIINDSILAVYTAKNANPFDADGNTDDMRLYLTSSQHRTFMTAWKTAGITLTDAKKALKAACK